MSMVPVFAKTFQCFPKAWVKCDLIWCELWRITGKGSRSGSCCFFSLGLLGSFHFMGSYEREVWKRGPNSGYLKKQLSKGIALLGGFDDWKHQLCDHPGWSTPTVIFLFTSWLFSWGSLGGTGVRKKNLFNQIICNCVKLLDHPVSQ
jgi:hypothetical protein